MKSNKTSRLQKQQNQDSDLSLVKHPQLNILGCNFIAQHSVPKVCDIYTLSHLIQSSAVNGSDAPSLRKRKGDISWCTSDAQVHEQAKPQSKQ